MIRVVAAAIVKDNKILCAQRSSSMLLPMKWEFPGGKIEPGETSEEALLREIKEELQAKIEIKDYINTARYDYPFGTVELKVYTAKLLSSTITMKEHAQLKWVAPEQLLSLDWAPVDLPAVHQLINQSNA